jgi:hypothetical protein
MSSTLFRSHKLITWSFGREASTGINAYLIYETACLLHAVTAPTYILASFSYLHARSHGPGFVLGFPTHCPRTYR